MVVRKRMKENFNSFLCFKEFEIFFFVNRGNQDQVLENYSTKRSKFVNSGSALSQLFHAKMLIGPSLQTKIKCNRKVNCG